MGISENPYPKSLLAAFQARLRELGWTEGSNLQTDYRWAAVDPAKSRAFARELVALQPDVILAHQNSSVEALLRETRTIPIVFVTVGDPIGNGFVGSYPHPGGNVTGFVVYEPAMAGKWLEILKDIVPGLSKAGVAYNPKIALSDFDLYLNALRAVGERRQVEINVAQYDGETELERVINEFASQPGGGLVLVPDNFLANRANLVVSLAAKYRLPGVYPFAYFAVGGGLVSYGIDPFDSFTKAPTYVDAVLRGAKPKDLPVQFPTKFELVINLKTAKTLGLEVPPSLLAVADRLIE